MNPLERSIKSGQLSNEMNFNQKGMHKHLSRQLAPIWHLCRIDS